MREIVIIGFGGHAYVVLDSCQALGIHVVGYCDQAEKPFNPFQLKYLGKEGPKTILDQNWIIAIGENTIRKKVYDSLSGCGQCKTVINPNAVVSSSARLGEGSFLSVGCIVNSLAEIGVGSIINSGAIVEHECRLGAFVHVAPGAVLAGGVIVGDNTFVGANAVVRQNIRIGSNVIIGAGTVVVKDVPDNSIVIGNPAKALKR